MRASRAKLKAANKEESLQKWKEYFDNLLVVYLKSQINLSIKSINSQVEIKYGPFTKKKRNAVLIKIKIRKVEGLEKSSWNLEDQKI